MKHTNGFHYLFLGGGGMAKAAAKLALDQPDTGQVTIVERSDERCKHLSHYFGKTGRIKSGALRIMGGDVLDDSIGGLMVDADVVFGCTTYDHNPRFTQLALLSGAHFCDLGGNDDIVREQLKLHSLAALGGLKFAPACGIAPGTGTILMRAAIDGLGDHKVRDARIYCGGLPQVPGGLLKYSLTFSVRGLINEYVEPVTEIRRSRTTRAESMGTVTEHDFSDLGLGMLESSPTSGALVMATDTYAGQIETMAYETLRYPGHWAVIKAWRDAGLFRDDITHRIGGRDITPREFMERHLESILAKNQPDLLVMRATAQAYEPIAVTYDLCAKADPKTGLSAMEQTTGFSLFTVGHMMATGAIEHTGAILHERDIPTGTFLAAWERAGVKVRKRVNGVVC